MLKVRIACVGKIKEKYFAQAVEEYAKRMTRFAEVSIKEVKEENFNSEPSPSEIEKILILEGERLKKELKGYVFCLAIEGEKLSSDGLAKTIRALKDKGEGEMTFVIGGSYGVAKEIKEASDRLISFSDMTFPHTLARVILTEQLYRAFMIDSGAKYHK